MPLPGSQEAQHLAGHDRLDLATGRVGQEPLERIVSELFVPDIHGLGDTVGVKHHDGIFLQLHARFAPLEIPQNVDRYPVARIDAHAASVAGFQHRR